METKYSSSGGLIIADDTSNSGSNAPQTSVVKAFAPGDGGLMEAINAQSTFRILVLQGPVSSGPPREYLVFEGGKWRIADPLKESQPYRDVDWDIYIKVGEWTQVKGQKRIPWKNDRAHRVLMPIIKAYPYDIDRFDAADAIGRLKVTKERFRSLIAEVRKLVGKDILPDRDRSLSKCAVIIIERIG